MKKQLVVTKIDNDYLLSMKDEENKNIKIVNKVVNGIDIYNVFYANVTEKIEYEVETELKDHRDTIIVNQLKALFDKIDTEVNNNCFNDEIQGE